MQRGYTSITTLGTPWKTPIEWIVHLNKHSTRACALLLQILSKLLRPLKLLGSRTPLDSLLPFYIARNPSHMQKSGRPEEITVRFAASMGFTPQAVEIHSVSRAEFMSSSSSAPIDLGRSHEAEATAIQSEITDRDDRNNDDLNVQSSSYGNAFELHAPKEPSIRESPDEIEGQFIFGKSYRPALCPLLSIEVRRYTRGITIPKRDKGKEMFIQPVTLRFEREPMTSGWVRCIHPEGALYYYNAEKRIYTEAYLDDPLVLDKIEKCISTLFEEHEITLEQQKIIDESDLVLEIYHEDDSMCGYYFANHESRTLFWLDEQNMQYDLHEVHGELTPSHMKYAMERFYWLHMFLFPHNHWLDPKIVSEAKAMLTWASIDELTSPTSPSLFGAEKLMQFISLVDQVENMLHDDCATATIGRILAEFAQEHFLNYHGERGARINSNQSVHTHKLPYHSSLRTIVFLALFNGPNTYLSAIEDIYTDDIVRTRSWKAHESKLKEGWEEYVLCSGVLLNANIALLALPHLIPDNVASSTAGQVASYLSMLTSMGSMIIGLLLQRQHRRYYGNDEFAAVRYLTTYVVRAGSIARLAVVYSLPHALLMWSMIAFLAAIAFECFNTRNTPTITMIAVSLVLLVGLILWCAYAGSHSSQASRATKPHWSYHLERMKTMEGRSERPGDNSKSRRIYSYHDNASLPS
ncbi:hypothetical protein BDW22DRAFT_1481531 [Trametopsis cervina]|nr:hypothetical protein BDW22DRAFT_1481531 [Trametopsis cervina]